jgi:hypothetical protein
MSGFPAQRWSRSKGIYEAHLSNEMSLLCVVNWIGCLMSGLAYQLDKVEIGQSQESQAVVPCAVQEGKLKLPLALKLLVDMFETHVMASAVTDGSARHQYVHHS